MHWRIQPCINQQINKLLVVEQFAFSKRFAHYCKHLLAGATIASGFHNLQKIPSRGGLSFLDDVMEDFLGYFVSKLLQKYKKQ